LYLPLYLLSYNRKIKLTNERWKHITDTHPELRELLKEISGALEDPELIKSSIYDDDVLLFYKFYEHIYEGKYICVIVKLSEEIVGFTILNFEKRFEHLDTSETLPIAATFSHISKALEVEG